MESGLSAMWAGTTAAVSPEATLPLSQTTEALDESSNRAAAHRLPAGESAGRRNVSRGGRAGSRPRAGDGMPSVASVPGGGAVAAVAAVVVTQSSRAMVAEPRRHELDPHCQRSQPWPPSPHPKEPQMHAKCAKCDGSPAMGFPCMLHAR